MKMLLAGGTIVNEGRSFKGNILVEGEKIVAITKGTTHPDTSIDRVIDASGCFVLPGIIDSHVHFREPGLTAKADIESESRAAAAGGVTTFFDMPNTNPATTSLEAWQEKQRLGTEKSHVNYAFFFGATHNNAALFAQLDKRHVPGIKLFMGSSTGNMLVDDAQSIEQIFALAGRMPVVAHCEEMSIINRNMQMACEGGIDDPEVQLHSLIRSEEACMQSTEKAIALARKFGTRLHVAHVTTAEEMELFSPKDRQITAEVCVGYLLFTMLDYGRLGARIKVNPAIKSPVDQFVLRQALTDGRVSTLATDHAPHLITDKQGGCKRAASGMPLVQFSLPAMLSLVDEGVLSIERMVELMAHQPARLFGVQGRGFLREGYQADIVVVRPHSAWTVTPQIIESRCKWSPLEGRTFQWRVEQTLCNGQPVYHNGHVDESVKGQAAVFYN